MAQRPSRITNAAPLYINRGVDDQSTTNPSVEPEPNPTHLPVFYLQTAKGTPGHAKVTPAQAAVLYGEESFNLLGKFANHQTVAATECIANGNAFFLHRVTDATYATVTVWLDVLRMDIPLYQREVDGSYSVDGTGTRIPTGSTTPGIIAKWVVSSPATNKSQSDLDAGDKLTGSEPASKIGDMVDPGNAANRSTMYPIYEIPAYSPGEDGNHIGFRHSVPEDIDVDQIIDAKAFIYDFQIVRKNSTFTSVTPLKAILGNTTVSMSLLPRATGDDGTPLYLPYVVDDNYKNFDDPRYSVVVPPLNSIKVYDASVTLLNQEIYTAESTYVKSLTSADPMTADELATATEYAGMTNLATATDLEGVPYYTFMIDEDASPDSVRLTPLNNIMLRGGEDNLLDNAGYEERVVADMNKYVDYDSEYHDLARFMDSTIWDTGFTVDTKDELTKYIHTRLNTFVVLSTFVDDPSDPRGFLTADEELAVALRLREFLRSHPESDYFGTATYRGAIFGGSGYLNNSSWRSRLPLTFDILDKVCRYMGPSSGLWKTAEAFSSAPGNIITRMNGISTPWTPASSRIRNWDLGLNLPLHYDSRNMFWPAMKTVTENDTSVLNSIVTAMAAADVNLTLAAAWRETTGVDDLSEAQVENKVNTFISQRLFSKYDGRFEITPNATHTASDTARGYSYTVPVDFRASNMKTVQQCWLRVYRKEGAA